jgi:DNA-binding transcriptional LysR family regulator
MHNQDWDGLRYFLAVARTGSLSAAAQALGLNHSTVLRRLARLEASLDVRLFERFQSGYQLTAAGEELHARLEPLAEQIDAAQRQVTGRDAELSGTIRLTTTDTLLHGLLAPMLAAFRREHPGIALQVVVNNHFLNLTRREADVAIRPADQAPPMLAGRAVGKVRTAPYAARAYLARARRQGIGAQEWARHDWVAPDDTLAHLKQAHWLARHVPQERHAIRLDTLLGMVDAVRAGFGVGMLVCALADRHKDLVRLGDPDPALDTQVWVLTHADLRQVRRIRALTAFLYEALGAHPDIIKPERR